MKKIISLIIVSAFCFSAYAQDTLNKKMESKPHNMNKKLVNPNDPMNKRPENHTDTFMIKKVPLTTDTMRRQSVPKSPEKKPAVI